jgi:hypothetical protein
MYSDARDGRLSEGKTERMVSLIQEDEEFAALVRETDDALSFLRSGVLTPEPSLEFDADTARLVRVQMGRDRFRYWSPALAGAVLAGVATLGIVASLTSQPAPTNIDQQTAQLERTQDVRFPAVN